MVLCLKTRESRSLPGLSRISPHHNHKTLKTRRSTLVAAALPFKAKRLPHQAQTPPPGNPKAQTVDAGWSSPVARQAHNLKVVSSNLAPATKSKSPSQKKRRAFCVFGTNSPGAGRRFFRNYFLSCSLRRRLYRSRTRCLSGEALS